MDDTYLQRAMSCIPSHSILLIEDIDCSFENRDNEDEEDGPGDGPGSLCGSPEGERRSSITLSGFLNAINGVGSEEGRLFFATVSAKEYINVLNQNIAPHRLTTIIDWTRLSHDLVVSMFIFNTSCPQQPRPWPFSCVSSKSSSGPRYLNLQPSQHRHLKNPLPPLQMLLRRQSQPRNFLRLTSKDIYSFTRPRPTKQLVGRARGSSKFTPSGVQGRSGRLSEDDAWKNGTRKVHSEEISLSRLFSWVALVKKVSLVWLLVL
jgi:hypothetical protein